MKTKSLIIVAASLALLAANSAAADGRGDRGRGHDDGRSYERHHSSQNHRSNDRYDNRGYDNRAYENRGRDDRRGSYSHHQSYNAPRPQHNYYSNNYYNAPRPYYNGNSYASYNRVWRRGDYLGHYHSRYQPVYYSHYRLRPPPRGYHWVRDDRGDFLLAAIATGIILEVILGGNY